jgi:uncharacterized membrane protein YfcA
MQWWWLSYLALGLCVGFFAGLLGIGGGIIIVPLLLMVFGMQHFPEDRVLHLALGTSIASIVFTSMSTVWAHQRRGTVRWDILREVTPGVVAGTLLGTFVANALPSRYLAAIFTAFALYSAVQMWLDIKPAPTRQLPGWKGMTTAALAVGGLSSLIGVGGGFLVIPLLTMCNVPMRNAIGTSAAIGLPLALSGTIGYLYNGLDKDHLPALSLGYIYLPALVGIVIGTFVTVPAGASAAHRLPVATLKKIFGIVLIVLAAKMLTSLF